MHDHTPRADSDPLKHTAHLKVLLDVVITHAREDVNKVHEPQAKAIFEMTAELLEAIKKTYEHYELKEEAAFSRGHSKRTRDHDSHDDDPTGHDPISQGRVP